MRLHCPATLFAVFLVPLVLSAQTPAAPASTQQPEGKTTTLSVAAKLVTVPVIIRDKKGALIQNVPRDDFTLQVDGKPQPIRYFDQDRDIPLTLGLMVDTSQSQRAVLDDERTASGSFLDQMLTGPKDQAFIIQFARQTDLLQDTTGSRPKLRAALKQIDSAGTSSTPPPDPQNSDPNDSNQSNSGGRRGGGRAGRGGGTTLYDALFLSSDELMKKQKGRKALIILSDGVDNGSKESLTKSLETAQRADTIVYAIYFKGEEHGGGNSNRGFGFPGGMGGGRGGGYPGGGGGGGQRGGGGGNGGGGNAQRVDGKKILQRMADETGGRLFEVTRKQTVEQIYTQIGQELRAQYRLGFTPTEESSSDGYHQLTVALKTSDEKKLTVQTRDGYYTGN